MICHDYARSEEHLGLSDSTDPFNRSRPETMAAVLEHVDRDWGGAAGCLGAHGVVDPTLARLRARLLDS